MHCVLAGLSYMLMHIFNVGVGMTFSGGLIDLTLFGILQGNAKTHWIWIVITGIAYAFIYFFVFYFMITKLDLKTPGREADNSDPKLYRRSDLEKSKKSNSNEDIVSAYILMGLGGKDNLKDLDCCATRLRVTVKDPSKVTDTMLKESGASGVIHKGDGVQVIYGPRVSVIKSNLEDFLESPLSDSPELLAEQKLPETPESAEKGGGIMLGAHMNGIIVPLENVEDEVFSQKILGDGAAIEPADGNLYAPCDGTIHSVFDTCHGVNMVSDEGAEILLHIGIDTVKLCGKHLKAHVSEGQRVKRGDLLITFDPEAIKAEGYKITTPLIICNTDDYKSVAVTAEGRSSISAGNKFIEIN